MRTYFSIISIFLFGFFFSQEQVVEIPLQYSVAGYAENNNDNGLNRIASDPLTPSINAEMTVNDAGALTYMVPIEILKGINNFQPNVALVYNSQSGNGQAGWGWNIVGLSTITRGGKSKEIDGLTIGPQFNDSDPFYLDGQRLIKLNETDYVTEKFSKIKITKYGSGDFSFMVQYTDGKVAKYKELTEGQHYISVMSDAYDNEIHYSYSTSGNVSILTKISYGGTSADNDKFYIDFVYKLREKEIKIYRNGLEFTNSKVLSAINTGATSGIYRKYELYHDFIEDNSVERIRTISISNENNQFLKPLTFNYNASNSIASAKLMYENSVGLSKNTTGLGSVTIGNFIGGDSKIQPIFQERTSGGYKLRLGNGANIDISDNDSGIALYAGKVLDLQNKITEKDQLISVNERKIGYPDLDDPNNPINLNLRDEIIFEIKNIVTGDSRKVTALVKGGLQFIDTYVPPADDPYDYYGHGVYETSYFRDDTKRILVQGDFNNDGLVDFLIIEPKNLHRENRIYLLELGKQNSGNAIEVAPVLLAQSSNDEFYSYYKEIYPIEFDGDGLPELFIVDKQTATYSIGKINFINNNLDYLLLNQPLPNFGNDTPIFFGDFNGDGLTDFLTPQKVYQIPTDDNDGLKMGATYYKMQTEQLLWWKYTGNGKTFIRNQENYTEQKIAYLKPSQSNYIKRSTFWQKFWNGMPDEYAYTRYSTHNIIIADFNNDGRSDIITLNKIGTAKYKVDGTLNGVPITNLGNNLTGFLEWFQIINFNSLITNRVNFYENKNLQGGTFTKLSSFPIDNIGLSPLSLILSSTQSDFLNVSKTGIYIFDPLSGNTKTILVDNDNFLEKQIQEVNNGSDVLQKIEYRNMMQSPLTSEVTYLHNPNQSFSYPFYVHKSNPSLYLVNKIHTVFNDNILTKEYRFENGIQHLEGKGFIGFEKIYASDAYESEIKNGKYIVKNPFKAIFWNIQTKAPLFDNSVSTASYGSLTKFFNITTNVLKRFDMGNHQYLILTTDEISQDHLKKITINKKYFYDESDDLKLKTAYTDYNDIGSTISKYSYKPEFNSGNHFFYGKIESVENTTYKDGLSFTTKENSNYNAKGAISESYKYSNDANAPPIITSYSYDNVGNMLSQTLSVQGITPQTTSYEYDATNRYVKKTTTPDGLASSAVVDILGRISEETSPLGLKTYYTYDTWGNITEITDYLGKKTTISKSLATNVPKGIYNLSKKREGGTETIVTFDQFDREVQTKTQSINGQWVLARIEYDIFGRKTKTSEPFFEGELPKWNEVEYDELSRPIKNTSFTGKTIITCYEGMRVTVDDGYKKTSKTLDAMGHTIRHQDHGGVIGYSYFPNGALKETNYEGIKTTFEIDGWGNKKKIIDPSAGTFTYEYDNISRLTREDNPKGYTLYTYDSLGRPLTEKTYGKTTAENTNIEKTYLYDPTSKLPTIISGTSNGQSFTYTTIYDQYFRISGKKEQTPDFTYTSGTTFDSFGRVDVVSISTMVNNPSLTSASSIKNIYDSNGILIQQNDNATGGMVWHVSNTNSQGQTVQMEYGNGYHIVNQYRPSDFSLHNTTHHNNANGIMVLDVDYDYDVNKGVLNRRNNKTFGKDEKYTYDKLNRLLSETVNNVLVNEYTYDNRGRITSNTELGQYNYEPGSYKLNHIAFNANGQNVNTQRGFATISYNGYKSPLNISLPGKDDLTFDYNILKSRYKMTSSVTGVTKLYSSDFAVEIIMAGQRTEIITYITGDPYSANYIKKTVRNKVGTSEANYYIHRDNLGSILAITATDGSVVEKRYFDAWGNLKNLEQYGEAVPVNEEVSPFLDRGYTGHEHLWKVGLINMNARIYDPILRKFLSPDNYVQDPFNTQNYDRYSYVLNNPLLYTDPSGNEILLGTAILIGIAVGIMANGISNMIQGIPFWYGMGKAGLMGGVTAAISFGIGSLATSTFSSTLTVGKALFEAGLHALNGGIMSAIEGGKFFAGALSGLVSSAISSGVQALGNLGAGFDMIDADQGIGVATNFGSRNPTLLKAIMISAGGLSGGISSSIAGGSFWTGMRQGIITAGLNHVAHMTTEFLQRNDPRDPTTWTRKYSMERIKKLYPKFYEVLAQLPDFLNSNPKVLDALVTTTKMTKTQILKHLDVNSSDGQVIVEYDYYASKNPAIRGNYGDTGHLSVTTISKNFILGLEQASLQTTIQATSFLLATTVLHEFVHWGRSHNGQTTYIKGKEAGNIWERTIFNGQTLNKLNAYDFSTKFIWNYK